MSGCTSWWNRNGSSCTCAYCTGKRDGERAERNRRTCTVSRSSYVSRKCMCNMFLYPCQYCQMALHEMKKARMREADAKREADLNAEYQRQLQKLNRHGDSYNWQVRNYKPGNLINTTDEGRTVEDNLKTRTLSGLERKTEMLRNLRQQGQEIQAVKHLLLGATPMASQLQVMKEIEKLERQREKVQMGIQELVL